MDDSVIKVERYAFKRCDKDKHGGDCLFYDNNCLEITPIEWIDNLGAESIWMDLHAHSQHYLIAGIYPQLNRIDYHDKLKNILETIWIKRKSNILLETSIPMYFSEAKLQNKQN